MTQTRQPTEGGISLYRKLWQMFSTDTVNITLALPLLSGIKKTSSNTYGHSQSELVSVLYIVIELPFQNQGHLVTILLYTKRSKLLHCVFHRVDQRKWHSVKWRLGVGLSSHWRYHVRDLCSFFHFIFAFVVVAVPGGRVVSAVCDADCYSAEGTQRCAALVHRLYS